MKNLNKILKVKQLDNRIGLIKGFEHLQFEKGWIKSIRNVLNVSLAQLGRRLNITAQAVKGMEDRERDGRITIRSLEEAAAAMDMKVVYAFLPKDGSLEELIEQKAHQMAKNIVLRSSTTMTLEDQGTSYERIEDAIRDLTQELKREMPGALWD